MKLRYIIIGLMIIMSLSACEEEVILVNSALKNDRITVNGIVDPDTVVFAYITEASNFDYLSSISFRSDYYSYEKVKYSRNRLFFSDSIGEKTVLSKANVELLVNGKDVYTMEYDTIYFTYNSDYVPKQGDNIKIRVESLSNPQSDSSMIVLDPVEAEVQLPSVTPKIKVISTEVKFKEREYHEEKEWNGDTIYITDLYGADTVMNIKLKIIDPVQEKNYYRLLVRSVGASRLYAGSYSAAFNLYLCVDEFKSEDRLFYDSDLVKPYGYLPAYFSNVFDDELLNGQEYEITVESRMRGKSEIPPYVILELQHLSPDLYYYLKDIEVFRISDFDLYTNPIQINSNVKGGWGVFGAMTYDTHIVPFENKRYE